jgi:hypothetical protein
VAVVSSGKDEAARVEVRRRQARWVEGPSDATRARLINLGLEAVEAEFVVLTSANVLPLGPDFLHRAVETVDGDPAVAAARCLQLNNVEQIRNWAQPRRISYSDKAQQRAAESRDGWAKDYPADDCCVVRRAVWREIRFDDEAPAHEDKIWASQALGRGWSVVACAPALWMQQRPPSPLERRRRMLREKRALYQITGKPAMSWGACLRASASAILRAPIEAVRQAATAVVFNFRLASIPRKSGPADGRLAAALRGESRE